MEPDLPNDPPSPAGIRARLGQRSTPAEPLRLADLPRGERRRAVLVCAASVLLAWILIFGAYAALPIAHESGLRAFTRLGVDIALVGAVLAWQIRRIAAARLPELRAVEALGVVIALFLALFASIYLAMSHESGQAPSRRSSITSEPSTSPSASSRRWASATLRRAPTRRAWW